MRTYNTIIGKRPFFNTDGDGISIKPLTNPSINGGSIFEVRSTAFASRLFCGQALTSSGQNPFYFGYFGNNGEEADSTKYNGVLATDGSVDCTEIKVNSIPLNSFTSFHMGADYEPSNRIFGLGTSMGIKTDKKISFSHSQQFNYNYVAGRDAFEWTCNSGYYGTYEITTTVIFRNKFSQRVNPVIGIAVNDDTSDISGAPNWEINFNSATPVCHNIFSTQYNRMSEGKVSNLTCSRIYNFTDSIDYITIKTYIENAGGDNFLDSIPSGNYRIISFGITFKYLGNFDNITTQTLS